MEVGEAGGEEAGGRGLDGVEGCPCFVEEGDDALDDFVGVGGGGADGG